MTLSAATTDALAHCPVVLVRVEGGLDVSTVLSMRERLFDALSLSPERLVVDLADCPSFDAAAINMLLDVHCQAWRQHSRLTLRGCSDGHLRVLALMRLHEVFDIEDAAGRP